MLNEKLGIQRLSDVGCWFSHIGEILMGQIRNITVTASEAWQSRGLKKEIVELENLNEVSRLSPGESQNSDR